MKKYECTGCARIHSWREWEIIAADPYSGIEVTNIIPGITIDEIEIRCDCGTKNRFYRCLICRDCKHGILDPELSEQKSKAAYKCFLGKSPNGQCWEEQIVIESKESV